MKKPPPRPLPPPAQRGRRVTERPRVVAQRGPGTETGTVADAKRSRLDRDPVEPAVEGEPAVEEEPLDDRPDTAGRALLVFVTLLVALTVVFVGLRLLRDRADTGLGASGPVYLDRLPPVAVPPTGSYVRSRILSNDDIYVSHWVRTGGPVRGIDLRLAGPRGTTGTTRATDVVVAADRRLVDGPQVVDGGRPSSYRFTDPSTLLHLTYVLKGAVERSPSAPGRALARVTALALPIGTTRGPTRVVLTGVPVKSVACTAPASPSPRPCGAPVGENGTWRVVLDGARRGDAVQAQVDLE